MKSVSNSLNLRGRLLRVCCKIILLLLLHGSTDSEVVKRSRCSNQMDCKNGGTYSLHSCQCVHGYTGTYCETTLPCVLNNTGCHNQGKCIQDIHTNTSRCICAPSGTNGTFEGAFCERQAPCHTGGYCYNGGICRRDPLANWVNYCDCFDNFTGPTCEEKTYCDRNDSCLHGGNCDLLKKCVCGNFTGFFCEMEISPAPNYSTPLYWAFNKRIPERRGASQVVKDSQLGNVISFARAGGGWADLDYPAGSCIDDLKKCPNGISFSFWLQYLEGVVMLSITQANNSMILLQADDKNNLVIQLNSGTKRFLITRSCFPVGWFHLTVTWNTLYMRYYENGQLLTKTCGSSASNSSQSQDVSLVTLSSHRGQGGFSTMRMSDLVFWPRVLSPKNVEDVYLKKLSSPFTSRCLYKPCPLNQWCEDAASGDSGRTKSYMCIQPTGFYCSFDNTSFCDWENVSRDGRYWLKFSKFGSLRHDHTVNSCAGLGNFIGLTSNNTPTAGIIDGKIISKTFEPPSVPGTNVSLIMWYYMEGWTFKNFSVVARFPAANRTLFSVTEKQSRKWEYLKITFPVSTVFQVILRGQLLGIGGIFVDDVFIEDSNSINIIMVTHMPTHPGAELQILCTAVTHAVFSFSWKRNGILLQASTRVKLEANRSSSTLAIRGTTSEDSGNYTCIVSKPANLSEEKTVYIQISEPPEVFISPLTKTSFKGESVTFHCYLSRGNMSNLTVVWYEKKEGNKEKMLGGNNDSFTLSITGALSESMERHVTDYRCVVRNPDGIDSSRFAKSVVLRQGDPAVCIAEWHYGVFWSLTAAGETDGQKCPNATGRIFRPCLSTGSGTKWGQVDASNCLSQTFKELYDQAEAVIEGYNVSRSLHEILQDLENVTAQLSTPKMNEGFRDMYEKDLMTAVNIMTRLVKYNGNQKAKPISDAGNSNNLVKTASNLLKPSNLPVWKKAVKMRDDLAFQMITTLDEYGYHSTDKLSDIHVDSDNVALITTRVSTNSSATLEDLRMGNGQSSLFLPATLFNQTNQSVTVVTIIMSTLGQVLSDTGSVNTSSENDTDWSLNSQVISVTMKPRPPRTIEPPFTVAMETYKVDENVNKKQCVSSNLTNRIWSPEGCMLVSTRANHTTTTCSCSHMTLFAVLMDYSEVDTPDHRLALSWISVVGCTLSLTGVFITLFVTFFFWRSLRSPRTVLLVHLCFAIAATDLLIIYMELVKIKSKTHCTVFAVLLHFFILSIFCWMLSEGIQMYFSLVKVIGARDSKGVKFYCCLGWGIPAVIASISLAATRDRGYADKQNCWLSRQNHVIWAFVAPALVIVLGNMVVFGLVIYSMFTSQRLRNEPHKRRVQRGLKASFVLLPLLGASWSFGVLTLTSNRLVFNYLFAIFNSMQGVFIFVFHCVLNEQVREVLVESRRNRGNVIFGTQATPSHRQLSATVDSPASSRQNSSATPLHLFKAEVGPSPQPSRSFAAFEETAFVADDVKTTIFVTRRTPYRDWSLKKSKEEGRDNKGHEKEPDVRMPAGKEKRNSSGGEAMFTDAYENWLAEEGVRRTRSESGFDSIIVSPPEKIN